MSMTDEECREIITERIKAKKILKTGTEDTIEPTTRGNIYALFNDPNSSIAALWVSNVINLVILASTFAFVTETVSTYRTPSKADFWFGLETSCVAAFTVDFVVRLATCPSFFDFRTDVMNWIDFVAIVPYYVELLFDLLGLDSGALSSLRVIRVLRLARILKIINKLAAANAKKDNEEDDNEKAGAAAAAGHNPGSPRLADDGLDHEEDDDGEDEDVGAVIGQIVVNSASALSIPLYFMLLALIVLASLEYFVEKVNPVDAVESCLYVDQQLVCTHMPNYAGLFECKVGENCSLAKYYEYPDGSVQQDKSNDLFPSIPDSVWWCIVTMTTVGYGDKYPLSGLGRIVAAVTACCGIFFISMPLAIVGSSFANAVEKINDSKTHKEAVMDSERYGYGKMSYTHSLHALMLMKVKELYEEILELDKRLNKDKGNLSASDSSFVFEAMMDLRENLTAFTGVLHKELFLHIIRIKKLERQAEIDRGERDADGRKLGKDGQPLPEEEQDNDDDDDDVEMEDEKGDDNDVEKEDEKGDDE